MIPDALGRVNTLRVVNALALPIPLIFGLPPNRRFELAPGDYVEIREEVPEEGYLEILVDDAGGSSSIWVHEWEEGVTEVRLNGVLQELPSAVRNNNPELRQRGWLAADGERTPSNRDAVGLFVEDARAGRTLLTVESGGRETAYSRLGRAPVWCSGAGSEDGPPRLFVESDGLRMAADDCQVVVDY